MTKKIEIKTKEIELKATGYDSNSIIDIIKAISNKAYLVDVEPSGNYTEENTVLLDNKKEENKSVDEVDLVEAISLHEIKNKVRLPRASSNFRCPHCAQAFITKVFSGNNSKWIFRDAASETPIAKGITIENVVVKDRNDKEELISLYKGLDELTFEKVILLYDESQKAFCPLCEKTDTLTNWMDAHSSPLDFFEGSNTCDICGEDGSIVMTEISSYSECANECLSKTRKNN